MTSFYWPRISGNIPLKEELDSDSVVELWKACSTTRYPKLLFLTKVLRDHEKTLEAINTLGISTSTNVLGLFAEMFEYTIEAYGFEVEAFLELYPIQRGQLAVQTIDKWRRTWFSDRRCGTWDCWCCSWLNKGKNKKLKTRRTRRRLKQEDNSRY